MNRKLFILAGCFVLFGTAVLAQAPVAQFTSNVTSGCAPLIVKFQDQSLNTNSSTTWTWSFSSPTTTITSYQENPNINFTIPGTYDVTLIVKGTNGEDAVRQTAYINIYASPIVSFGLDKHLACSPAVINFQQFSQAGQGVITDYEWDFGDGHHGIGATPQNTYSGAGYYNVTLTVTNSGGCSNTATYLRTLRLINGFQANFTWSETGNTCSAPYTLAFNNQTQGPGNMSYVWSFGGGASPTGSGAVNPSGVSYPGAGNYPVTLIAQSDLGCGDTITQTVPLTSNMPVIVAPTAGCLNTPITFTDSSAVPPLSVSWNFGDGTPPTANPTHSFAVPNTYTVTVTNTYANCSSKATANIAIGAALVPSFSANPTTGCQAPLSVQFTDNDVPADNQWTWTFGDGATVSGTPNPSHTYSTPGNYTVTLTATSPSGCSGTDSISKLVNITAPVINITGQGACVGQAYTPTYTVTTVDPVATYTWNAPGATPSSQSGPSPIFTFPSTGVYSVTVSITTGTGCTANQTFNVQVGTPTPAAFTYSPNSPICGTAVVTFTSSSTPADHWYWNFGGGNSDSGQSVTYQFKKFGTQTVTLSVSNDGCVTNASQTVTVTPPIPNFGWVVDCANNNPLIANNLTVSFQDSSLTSPAFGPITYNWDYGDTHNSGNLTAPPYLPPAYTYAAPGSYNLTLTVTNGGCIAYAYKTLVLEDINASFTPSATTVCNQQNFTLTSTSTTTPFGTANAGYIWALGPGDTIHAGSTFTGHITGVGTYPTTLTVIDQNGCRYTSPAVNITVTAPTAKFTAPAGGCVNGAVTFTDNSTPSALSGSITGYVLNFGDSTGNHTFPAPPLTHSYADTGTYTVIEIVVDGANCAAADTIVNAVQITSPHASFIEPDSFYCPGIAATFTDFSTGYGLSEVWDYGDGTVQPGNTHPFPATSGISYAVKLTVTDKYGCTSDTTENIKIESPVAAFTIADTTSICAPLETIFTSQALYDSAILWKFGDGQTSTLANTSKFYNTLDTFTATLVAYGPGGCADSASRKVFLTNPATTIFNFTPKTACDSVVAQFTIGPPAYTRFTLQFGDNTADSSQNLTPVHTYKPPNTYLPLLYLTDATGCIVTRSDTVLTVLGAVPFFTATPTAFCDTGTVAFTDFTITNDGVLNKTLNFGDQDSITQLGNPPIITSHFYTTPGNLLATLTVTTLSHCVASYTDTIHVFQTPLPIVADTGYLCAGLVQFQGKLVQPEVDTVFWQWDFGNGQTANVQNPLAKIAAGTYTVHLKASVSFGCSDTASASVTINPNPTIKGPKEITTPVGVPVTIPFIYSGDVTSWSWTPVANLNCSDCANPSATLTFAQTYSVLVTDSNNCIDTASILIKTACNEQNYFLPNTFSPNGDGVNDYFYPRGTSLYNIQSMTVFNRWGQMVFQRKNFPANSESMGWDGTVNGKPAPSDAYVYIVEVICNNAQIVALHGNVTLIR